MRAMAGLQDDVALDVFEEVKVGMVQRGDPAASLHDLEIGSGDILCAQICDTSPNAPSLADHYAALAEQVCVLRGISEGLTVL